MLGTSADVQHQPIAQSRSGYTSVKLTFDGAMHLQVPDLCPEGISHVSSARELRVDEHADQIAHRRS